MAEIVEVPCETWGEFKSAIYDEFPASTWDRGQMLFRGLGDADWHLVTAFDRHFSDVPVEERREVLQELLRDFRDACQSQGLTDASLSNEIELQALGQHYGLPTRLLDWSESPYVAAYFAFQVWTITTETSPHVAIWALDTQSPLWQSDMGVEVVQGSSHVNERLRRQAGRFTYARTPFRTLEDYVRSCDVRGPGLWQFTLPWEAAVEALPDLDLMGISARSLFPDLSGAAASAHMRVGLSLALRGRK